LGVGGSGCEAGAPGGGWIFDGAEEKKVFTTEGTEEERERQESQNEDGEGQQRIEIGNLRFESGKETGTTDGHR
jgi:hypothetical protein